MFIKPSLSIFSLELTFGAIIAMVFFTYWLDALQHTIKHAQSGQPFWPGLMSKPPGFLKPQPCQASRSGRSHIRFVSGTLVDLCTKHEWQRPDGFSGFWWPRLVRGP